MTTRTAGGTAQQLHLSRAARTAGEAFAFDEPENLAGEGRTRSSTALFVVALALIAVASLYLVVG